MQKLYEALVQKRDEAVAFCRETGVLTLLQMLAVVYITINPFFRTFLPHANISVFAAVCLIVIIQIKKHGFFLRWCIPLVVMFVFVVFAFLDNNQAIEGISDLVWFVLCASLSACLMLLTSNHDFAWERIMLVCIALSGLFYALATILFWLVPSIYDEFVYPYLMSMLEYGHITQAGYKAGLTFHYSTNGMYIALGVMACFALALEQGRFWKVATAVALFALILTTKRAHLVFAVAAMVAVYCIWGWEHKRKTFGKLAVAVVVALVTLLAASLVTDDVVEVFERLLSATSDDSFGGRSSFYELCITMWLESPLIGNGWDSYTTAFNLTELGEWYQSQGFLTMDAHNVYLQVLAEEGLVGLALFLTVLISGIVATLRRLLVVNKRDETPDGMFSRNRSVLAGSLTIQLFFAMYCITGNPLYDIQMYVPWLLSIGIAYAAVPKELDDEFSSQSPREWLNAVRACFCGARKGNA